MTETNTIGEHYTDSDHTMIANIRAAISAGVINQSTLAKRANVNPSTFSQALNGIYPSSPSAVLNAAEGVIKHMQTRAKTKSQPIVETSVFRNVTALCKRAQVYKTITIISANVGTGKTTALKEYRKKHQNVFLIEITPGMTTSVFLSDTVKATGATVEKAKQSSVGSLSQRLQGIINQLQSLDCVLILDESENASPMALEYARRIHDIAECGLVLAGTARLKQQLASSHGQFGQIHSRVGAWPDVIEAITPDDAVLIIDAALADEFEMSDEIYEAFWSVTQGSARVLARALIPAIRDYVINRGKQITPDLIVLVAEKLLGFQRRTF